MDYCFGPIHLQLTRFLWPHVHMLTGGDIVDRRSIFGHYLFLNSNPIVWSSKKQYVVSRFNAEV